MSRVVTKRDEGYVHNVLRAIRDATPPSAVLHELRSDVAVARAARASINCVKRAILCIMEGRRQPQDLDESEGYFSGLLAKPDQKPCKMPAESEILRSTQIVDRLLSFGMVQIFETTEALFLIEESEYREARHGLAFLLAYFSVVSTKLKEFTVGNGVELG